MPPHSISILAASAIGSDSLVSVGVVVIVVSCTAYLVRTINNVQRDIKQLQAEQYTLTAACEHALRMAMANPDLAIPDPRNPRELLSGGRARD